MPSIVTANKLRTGAVVYLAHDGTWVDTLARAFPAHTSDDLQRLEGLARAAVERNEVTAVYAFDVDLLAGVLTPLSVRERIRAALSASA